MANPRRATSFAFALPSGEPITSIEPDNGGIAPAMVSNVVVLPAPLAPRRQTTSPSRTVRSRSRTTGTLP